ncbi:MAG: SCO1664 family protein [Actinomycetota bacterium]|nr:SCO1664 family protein [Actinomycetota bacterium]
MATAPSDRGRREAGDADALDVLRTGHIDVLGLLPYSSNYTFLARATKAGTERLAVYKPRSGERPLWDFPRGTLAAREVAAWLVSEASWKIVPPTVLRDDAPLGEGSLQLFIQHDPERHYFVLMDDRHDALASFAAFDAVINNADRKAGHVIEDPDGRLWAVDHGLTFHTEPKLRTVIWAFAEERLTPPLRVELEELGAALADDKGLGGELAALLSPEEAEATLARVETLLIEDRFPAPQGDRPLPWPLI